MTRLKCTETGEWIDLGKEIKSSGEGKIYETKKDGFLAKIYHEITQEKIDKLKVMVTNPPINPTESQGHVSIAWPKCSLQDSDGKIVGFLMPEIVNGQTLINVYNPSVREQNASGFNWLYLHTAAMNIASALEAIHEKDYVVGDLKPDNILVMPTANISIIDVDSFQIVDKQSKKIYRSPVASSEYTPPEMIGKDCDAVDRSEYHDYFGLAVIIWHLLFGYHPFSGQWSGKGNQPDIDTLIKNGYWIYGSNSKLSPVKHSIPLKIIHSELQNLFRKCFDNGHNNPNARPSAKDWKKGLQLAIQDLVQCSIEKQHYYAKSYGKCYWCERKDTIGHDIFRNVISPSSLPNSIPKPPNPKKVNPLIGLGAIFLVLAVITLPSFTNQANKAKQSEAKQYVGSMNRQQQALFTEKSFFTTELSFLGLGIQSETQNYKYFITGLFDDQIIINMGQSKHKYLKNYVGIVSPALHNNTEKTTYAILCEQSQASTDPPDLPTVFSENSENYSIQCPSGYSSLGSGSSFSIPKSLIDTDQLSASNLPDRTTPENTIRNFYALTTKDNKMAGKLFTTDDFKNKFLPSEKDSQKKFVSLFSSIEVTGIESIQKSSTRAKMKVWLHYSFKDSRPDACEYRDFTLIVDDNQNYLIDDIGDYNVIPCS